MQAVDLRRHWTAIGGVPRHGRRDFAERAVLLNHRARRKSGVIEVAILEGAHNGSALGRVRVDLLHALLVHGHTCRLRLTLEHCLLLLVVLAVLVVVGTQVEQLVVGNARFAHHEAAGEVGVPKRVIHVASHAVAHGQIVRVYAAHVHILLELLVGELLRHCHEAWAAEGGKVVLLRLDVRGRVVVHRAKGLVVIGDRSTVVCREGVVRVVEYKDHAVLWSRRNEAMLVVVPLRAHDLLAVFKMRVC